MAVKNPKPPSGASGLFGRAAFYGVIEMKLTERQEEILKWGTLLRYHLDDHARANLVGSIESAYRSQTKAAECAAIMLGIKVYDEIEPR